MTFLLAILLTVAHQSAVDHVRIGSKHYACTTNGERQCIRVSAKGKVTFNPKCGCCLCFNRATLKGCYPND